MHPWVRLGRAKENQVKEKPKWAGIAQTRSRRKPCATHVQVKMHPWVRLGRAEENQVKEKPKWAGIAQTRSRRNPDQADRLLPGQLKT